MLNVVRLKLQQPLESIDGSGILVHVVPGDCEDDGRSQCGFARTELTLD